MHRTVKGDSGGEERFLRQRERFLRQRECLEVKKDPQGEGRFLRQRECPETKGMSLKISVSPKVSASRKHRCPSDLRHLIPEGVTIGWTDCLDG